MSMAILFIANPKLNKSRKAKIKTMIEETFPKESIGFTTITSKTLRKKN